MSERTNAPTYRRARQMANTLMNGEQLTDSDVAFVRRMRQLSSAYDAVVVLSRAVADLTPLLEIPELKDLHAMMQARVYMILDKWERGLFGEGDVYIADGYRYSSVAQVCEATGVHRNTVYSRMKSDDWPDWLKVERV